MPVQYLLLIVFSYAAMFMAKYTSPETKFIIIAAYTISVIIVLLSGIVESGLAQ